MERLVLISGNFHRDGWIIGPSHEGDIPEEIAARYAEVSPDGPEHLGVLRHKLADCAAAEPALAPGDLADVPCRTLVMSGDDDLVTLEHTVQLYRGLPDAELAVVPGTSHGLLAEKPGLCRGLVAEFLAQEPVSTWMPIRRAG